MANQRERRAPLTLFLLREPTHFFVCGVEWSARGLIFWEF